MAGTWWVFVGFWACYFVWFGFREYRNGRFVRENAQTQEHGERWQEKETHYRGKAETAWFDSRRKRFAKKATKAAEEVEWAEERSQWLLAQEEKRRSKQRGRWTPKPMLRKGAVYLAWWLPATATRYMLLSTRPNWIEETIGSVEALDPIFLVLMFVLAMIVYSSEIGLSSDSGGAGSPGEWTGAT